MSQANTPVPLQPTLNIVSRHVMSPQGSFFMPKKGGEKYVF